MIIKIIVNEDNCKACLDDGACNLMPLKGVKNVDVGGNAITVEFDPLVVSIISIQEEFLSGIGTADHYIKETRVVKE